MTEEGLPTAKRRRVDEEEVVVLSQHGKECLSWSQCLPPSLLHVLAAPTAGAHVGPEDFELLSVLGTGGKPATLTDPDHVMQTCLQAMGRCSLSAR